MNKYEMLYILSCEISDEAKDAIIAKFENVVTAGGGSVTSVDKWGVKKLVYPINYKTEGYYVLVNYTAEASVPKEIERNLQISDSILRYLTVKVEEKRSNVKPRPVRVAPVAEEAAPAVEAAPAAEAEAPAQAE